MTRLTAMHARNVGGGEPAGRAGNIGTAAVAKASQNLLSCSPSDLKNREFTVRHSVAHLPFRESQELSYRERVPAQPLRE